MSRWIVHASGYVLKGTAGVAYSLWICHLRHVPQTQAIELSGPIIPKSAGKVPEVGEGEDLEPWIIGDGHWSANRHPARALLAALSQAGLPQTLL